MLFGIVPKDFRYRSASIVGTIGGIDTFSFVDASFETALAVSCTILLVRHAAHVELGETLSGRRKDVALSSEGLEQSAILADLLGTEPIAAVYSSPVERAWYTARDIAEPHGLKVQVRDELDEIDFGEWTGKSFSELEGDEAWQRWNESRSTSRCPGGESMAEAIKRAVSAIEAIAGDHDERTITAVTHCDIIRGVIAHYVGLPFDNILRLDIDPASVSRLEVGRWGARVGSINERLYQ